MYTAQYGVKLSTKLRLIIVHKCLGIQFKFLLTVINVGAYGRWKTTCHQRFIFGKTIIPLTPQCFSTQPENTHCHERTDGRQTLSLRGGLLSHWHRIMYRSNYMLVQFQTYLNQSCIIILYLTYTSLILCIVCLRTGPLAIPKWVLQWVRSSLSSFRIK